MIFSANVDMKKSRLWDLNLTHISNSIARYILLMFHSSVNIRFTHELFHSLGPEPIADNPLDA